MKVLTRCPKCNTIIHSFGGCCGQPLKIIYNCPCGEETLRKFKKEQGMKK